MWTTYREAGRPIPRFSDDDFIDYCVIEAISLKVRKQEADAKKKAERDQWKKETRKRLAKEHG